MPTWGAILTEFNTVPNTPDSVRRKYLSKLAKHSGRDTILYSTKWTDPSNVSPDIISITEEDIQGFMEDKINKNFMDISDLSEYLGIKKSTVYAWIYEKKIPYYKIGRLVKFKKKEIDSWIDTTKQQPIGG